MHRLITIRAVICMSTLFPSALLYAAPEDMEQLKQELLELHSVMTNNKKHWQYWNSVYTK